MSASLNPALREFWTTKADVKILKGGRASSKTWDCSGVAIYLASKYKLKFLCMRQVQSKIQESVYAILVIQIERFGLLDEFEILKTSIVHKLTGSSFHFYGISRNISEIKGFEGADIGWIEEGEGLTKEQWEIIEPTLRKEGAEAWILFNPKIKNDFVITNFKHDPSNGVIVRHINYDENPYLSNTMLRKIERMKESNQEDYEHIYLGVPLSDDDSVVIKYTWLLAAVDAHIKLNIDVTGEHFIGYDVADSGADKNCYVTTKGILATECNEWKGKEDELRDSAFKVYQRAKELNAHVIYDSIGVGAGVGSNIKAFNKDGNTNIVSNKFNAGDKVLRPEAIYSFNIKNKDMFANLKAQAWWNVADRLRITYNAVTKGEAYKEDEIISIDSSIDGLDELLLELSTPKRDFDLTGKTKVESKKDLAKRDVKSPNKADAFIMAYQRPFKKERVAIIPNGVRGVMS